MMACEYGKLRITVTRAHVPQASFTTPNQRYSTSGHGRIQRFCTMEKKVRLLKRSLSQVMVSRVIIWATLEGDG